MTRSRFVVRYVYANILVKSMMIKYLVNFIDVYVTSNPVTLCVRESWLGKWE